MRSPNQKRKPANQRKPKRRLRTLAERLARIKGKAPGLPADASVNHDHYLYGAPKQQ
jgi:hypothetical protein